MIPAHWECCQFAVAASLDSRRPVRLLTKLETVWLRKMQEIPAAEAAGVSGQQVCEVDKRSASKAATSLTDR